jgi:redox-sensitive bicupin YhaK (pirin superfamily)
LLVDLELEPGACVAVPPAEERGVFVIEGVVELGTEQLVADRLAVLVPGAAAQLRAIERARVMVLGGPPVGARLMEWNFVASTRDRLDRARDAWKAQTFPKIPGDDQEFVPFPELRR